MHNTKSFIVGATLLVLVLISGNIGLGCGTEPAQTPTGQEPVSPAAPLSPEVTQLPEETGPSPPMPEATASFTTYTDESNYFSISYPSDWEISLSYIGVDEGKVKKTIDNLKTDMPIESPSRIFFAGRRAADGFDVSLNIVVEKAFEDTVDLFVRSMIEATKTYVSDYREFSSVKTTVDGKEAIIVEWEGAYQERDERHYVQMFMMIDGIVWTVTCATSPKVFAQWENDFDAIVRSLRIYD